MSILRCPYCHVSRNLLLFPGSIFLHIPLLTFSIIILALLSPVLLVHRPSDWAYRTSCPRGGGEG